MIAFVSSEREFPYTEEDFRFVAERVKDYAGITLSEHKRDMVYSRLARRVRALGLKSIKEYCALLESAKGQEEIGDFVNALTTNLTSFYRESHHFNHLEQLIRKLSPGGRMRLWSAGCSAGMEPYTMALTCNIALDRPETRDIKILATDIDTNILDRAALGAYTAKDVEKIPSSALNNFFIKKMQDGEMMYEAGAALKRLISFKQLNLMGEWPMKGPFDVILCRNVMIYFDKPTQERLVKRFASLLRPGAFLYIGHSESIRGMEKQFRLLSNTIYQRV